ncbi:MAG TPA: hypothetical protein VF928_05000 [Usitatibacteraceae bacterium]
MDIDHGFSWIFMVPCGHQARAFSHEAPRFSVNRVSHALAFNLAHWKPPKKLKVQH